MRALFVLTPAESKRLIAKAVASMKEIKRAQQNDKMVIGHGSTNVFVAEEIMGKAQFSEFIDRDKYVSGLVVRGVLCGTVFEEKGPFLVLNRGVVERPAPTMAEILCDFGPDGVFIKGANALDPEGNAGAFSAHPEGGTIGWAIGAIVARGIHLIVPVGLEKLVPSVKTAVSVCGMMRLDYCEGMRVGMVPLSGAKVITEIEALRILTGVESFHVASGGTSGSEGTVSLVTEGEAKQVKKAIELIESIKGEPPLAPRKGVCLTCGSTHCHHHGKSEENLPAFLRNR